VAVTPWRRFRGNHFFVALVGCALVGAALLSACGGGQDTPGSPTPVPRAVSQATPQSASVSASGPEESFPGSWNSLEGADGPPASDFQPPSPSSAGVVLVSPIAAVTPFLDQFGEMRRDGLTHAGIDIDLRALPASPVRGVCEGTILSVSSNDNLSLHVAIDCGGGWTALIGFLGAVQLKPGSPTSTTAVVGTSDPTGHFLHFEVRFNGIPVNPADVVEFPVPPPPPTPRPTATQVTVAGNPTAGPTATAPATAATAATPSPTTGTGVPPTAAPPTPTPTWTPTPSPTPRPRPTSTPTAPIFR
jgi:hypothetical protein